MPNWIAKKTLNTSFCMFLMIILTPLASADTWNNKVTQAAKQNFPEYLSLLAIPNVANHPSDIQRNAIFLEQAFKKRGFKTQLLNNNAKRPEVFAQWFPQSSNKKTILFYIHFDGQPIIPKDWSQADPFEPVVKQRNSHGKWVEVPQQQLFTQPLDPELRVFARGASDDKAPIMMFLTAFDLLKSEGKTPAYNVKVILDAEEEIGSPSLASVIHSHPALFNADALVILDGPVHDSGRPTLAFGNRGIAQVSLTVYGPRSPLHSGHYANYVPNPAMRLASLLASMKDDRGHVLIKGYDDGINLTPNDRAILAETPDNEAMLRQRVGIAKSEAAWHSFQEAIQYPSLNIRGMVSAAIGPKTANIIPSEATAELDLRTTPEADGHHLFQLLKTHIEKQGYHLIDGTPSDQDREKYNKIASLHLGSVKKAERMPMDSSIGHWAMKAAQSATSPNTKPVRIRMMGGTVPTDVLIDALHIPFVMMLTVNADNNQHTFDENLKVGNFISGTQSIYSLLVTPYPINN
ncbi:MAG: M20/M25/M40 family metallo-hydrolase [Gammaproteobacteria bacterium]|nr:M20/M25/M40 family metallo-hydrolase [Gammaproteobacteria bacterium]